jgi:signal transduction histidine kinase
VLALGAFVYLSIRHEILGDFDDRIVEETSALLDTFAKGGREPLAKMLEARGSSGGTFAYGLESPNGDHLAGDLRAPGSAAGWMETVETDGAESPEAQPEIVRALVTRLSDGSRLIVGDEQRRSEEILRTVLSAFGWAVAATIAFGTAGGLWLSAQFLSRVDAMRLTAQRLMAGDWSRRIPLSPIDDDLTALGRTFNRLFDRIEKLLLANKQVSADIAHDLRKPLASTLRRLEAARDAGARPEAARAAVGVAITEIEDVLETFNALLRIGQIEAGARRAAFRPLDLAEVVREVVDAFQPAAEEEGKTILTHIDASLPVSADKELLVLLMANLVDNALRHTPPGVRIEVTAEQTSRGLLLSVADDGPGVAPHELKTIFQRFYRADAARQYPGTGLGLNLVRAIAELHDFECSASDNRPGLLAKKNGAPSLSVLVIVSSSSTSRDVARSGLAFVADHHRANQVFPMADACQRDAAQMQCNKQ